MKKYAIYCYIPRTMKFFNLKENSDEAIILEVETSKKLEELFKIDPKGTHPFWQLHRSIESFFENSSYNVTILKWDKVKVKFTSAYKEMVWNTGGSWNKTQERVLYRGLKTKNRIPDYEGKPIFNLKIKWDIEGKPTIVGQLLIVKL